MNDISGTDDQELCNWISRSTRKLKAMAALLRGSNTVKGIADEMNLNKSHVSSAIKELREKNLVESVGSLSGREKLFTLTGDGYRITRDVPVLNLHSHRDTVSRVESVLDELSIPYAKNVKLNPGAHRGTADFVILKDYKPSMAIAVRMLPYDAYKGLKDATFWVGTWKEETEELKTVLVLGGKPKERVVKEEGKFFLKAEFMDVVIHEEDLECIREKELGLEEILEVEKHCVDWPDLEEKKKNG